MPSRSFRQESSVYLYYDVYNLLRGANGRTRYRVDYEARGGGPDAARRLFERIARFLGRDEDRKITRISYEHEGFQGSEPLCVTLDLSAKATETSKSTSQLQLQSSRGSTNLPYPVTRN